MDWFLSLIYGLLMVHNAQIARNDLVLENSTRWDIDSILIASNNYNCTLKNIFEK